VSTSKKPRARAVESPAPAVAPAPALTPVPNIFELARDEFVDQAVTAIEREATAHPGAVLFAANEVVHALWCKEAHFKDGDARAWARGFASFAYDMAEGTHLQGESLRAFAEFWRAASVDLHEGGPRDHGGYANWFKHVGDTLVTLAVDYHLDRPAMFSRDAGRAFIDDLYSLAHDYCDSEIDTERAAELWAKSMVAEFVATVARLADVERDPAADHTVSVKGVA
jgi:hypothetical protein